MRGKFVVSLAVVIGLEVLSATAYISAGKVEADGIAANRGMAYGNILERAAVLRSVPAPAEAPAEKASKEPNPCWKRRELRQDRRDGEEYLLARLAMAEAEGEDTEGKALVIMAVLNRVRDAGFPDTVEGVIYQRSQFSSITDGRFDAVEPDEDCWLALSMVQQGWDGSKGATYFHSERESSWHERNLSFLFRHGAHYFYTDREVMDYE